MYLCTLHCVHKLEVVNFALLSQHKVYAINSFLHYCGMTLCIAKKSFKFLKCKKCLKCCKMLKIPTNARQSSHMHHCVDSDWISSNWIQPSNGRIFSFIVSKWDSVCECRMNFLQCDKEGWDEFCLVEWRWHDLRDEMDFLGV